MNHRKPLAERHSAFLQIEQACAEARSNRQRNETRSRANKAFMQSLSELEHTLAGETEVAIEHQASGEVLSDATELEELEEAVADIEAYIHDRNPLDH